MAYPMPEERLPSGEVTLYATENRTVPAVIAPKQNDETVKERFFILERLKQLRDSGKYCDVTLDVKGTMFEAHKNVLASWSPYFESQLVNTAKVCKEVVVVNYDNYEVFSDLLEFMYTGSVAPRETNFIQLLHLAVSFQIDLLKGYCEEFLRCNLHLGNFISTYFLCRKYRLHGLEEYIVGFLQMNLSDAVKQAEFLSLSASRFNAFLSNGWMEQIKPEIKLFLIISWVGCDVRERERFLVLLLRHIDWSTVASDFLLEISRTENFFTSHESSLYLLLQTLFSSGISLGPYTDLFPALRQRHSHLLSQVVQSSLLPPEVDEFFPITVKVQDTRPAFVEAAVNTDAIPVVENVEEAPPADPSPKEAPEPPDDDTEGNDTLGEWLTTGDTSEMAEALTPDMTESSRKASPEPLSEETDTPVKLHKRKGRPRKVTPVVLTTEEPVYDLRDTKKPIGRGKKGLRPRGRPRKNSKGSPDPVETPTSSKPGKNKEEVGENMVQLKVKAEQVPETMETAPEDLDYDDDKVDMEYMPPKRKLLHKHMGVVRGRRGRPTKGGISRGRKHHCPHCDYSNIFPGRLDNHIKRVHESNHVYMCNVCQFSTKYNRAYYSHMKTHFEDAPPYHCDGPDCQYTTDRIQSMLIHRMTHSQERPFPCDQCGMSFRTRNNLYAHAKLHTGLKPFCCPFCSRSFATKNTMEQHLVTHSDHRPYLCDTCGFSTKYQSHLIAHKRIHTGEVYRCQFPKCNYYTPKRSQLKAHMRSHLGIRSHLCPTCNKTFIEKSHLVRHERIHMNEKPFKCKECEYSTTRMDKLKEHVDKHHGDNATAKIPYKPRKPRRLDLGAPPTMVTVDHAGYTLHPRLGMPDPLPMSSDQFIRTQMESIEQHIPLTMDQVTMETTMTDQREILMTVTPDSHNTTSLMVPLRTSATPLPTVEPVVSSVHSPVLNIPTPMVTMSEDQHQGYTVTVTHPPQLATTMPMQQTGQPPDYGGLSAFMALF